MQGWVHMKHILLFKINEVYSLHWEIPTQVKIKSDCYLEAVGRVFKTF